MADKKNIELPEAGVSQELDNFELWVVENRKKICILYRERQIKNRAN